jgi:DNA-binding NtrC family response regulator
MEDDADWPRQHLQPVATEHSCRERSSIQLMGTLAPAPRILGREAEIRALGEALEGVASGAPTIVLIEGEAGIGKTRLLQDHRHLRRGAR